MLDLPAVGARWYHAGEHWAVHSHTSRDGEPAVRLTLLRKPRSKCPSVVIWRLMSKKAVPSGKER